MTFRWECSKIYTEYLTFISFMVVVFQSSNVLIFQNFQQGALIVQSIDMNNV